MPQEFSIKRSEKRSWSLLKATKPTDLTTCPIQALPPVGSECERMIE
jgi:hypothetical protein